MSRVQGEITDCEETNETLLAGGLYCDFGPRPQRRQRDDEAAEKQQEETEPSQSRQSLDDNGNNGSRGDRGGGSNSNGNGSSGIGRALLRGTSSILKIIGGSKRSQQRAVQQQQQTREGGNNGSVASSSANGGTQTMTSAATNALEAGGLPTTATTPMSNSTTQSQIAQRNTMNSPSAPAARNVDSNTNGKPSLRSGPHRVATVTGGTTAAAISVGPVSNDRPQSAVSTQNSAAKPKKSRGPRRGSHMMPVGIRMPTSAELLQQKGVKETADPSSNGRQKKDVGKAHIATNGSNRPQQSNVATTTTTIAATDEGGAVSKQKKSRGLRRGSHMMPAGVKMPTSAELLQRKLEAGGAAPISNESNRPQSNLPPADPAAAVSANMANSKKSRGQRRGSHMMPVGVKMPTSAELLQRKGAAARGTNTATASNDETNHELQSNTEQAAFGKNSGGEEQIDKPKAKPRCGPRRGSHMMPTGMALPTSAELLQRKGSGGTATAPHQLQPNGNAHHLHDESMGAAVTVDKEGSNEKKLGSNENSANMTTQRGAPSSSYSPLRCGKNAVVEMDHPPATGTTPRGQMQKLSVSTAQRDWATEPAAVSVSAAEALPSVRPPGGRTRARRRGSVVKTMVESGPKNVDGDGRHLAMASTQQSHPPLEYNDKSDLDYNRHLLPQRRSSQESEEVVTGGVNNHKRPMLAQQSTAAGIDDGDYHGATDRFGHRDGEQFRSSRGSRKKKDIGRKAIRSIAADLTYVHRPVPKSNDARELIYDAIEPNILFRACSPEELVDLVDAFEPQYVPKGSVVIKEGDEGDDRFYVVERGGVDIYEKRTKKCSLYSGVAFGEIALLYSCPRTATVLAKYDCKLWVIDRRAFRGITAQHKKRRLELKVDFLKKVKIHDEVLGEILEPSEIQSVALATKIEKFRTGSSIVRQGEKGDAFYMIEEGQVDVYIREKGDMPIVTLDKGAFFGEKALLSSDVRTATCVASSDVKCMLLMREDFVLMLGNLQDLLDRSYIARDEALRADHETAPREELSHRQTQRFSQGDFELKRTLGVGAFGFVKLVKWKLAPTTADSDSYYALKCVSKQKIIEMKQQEKIKREEDIMTSLVHPFIARCYHVMEDERGKYFLMEALCGGELCELLYHETQFNEEWSMFYSASVLSAFALIHERKVAYRDLKPENLVLDTAGYVKIVDFGLAKVISQGQTYTFCGTPDYLAPEVILNEGYDWAVDYWGLGVLIYEMMAGVAPFYAESPMETYEKVLSGHVHIPAHFSHAAANLTKKLLHASQSKRMGRTVGGAKTVMRHPWYSGFDWIGLMEYKLQAPFIPEERDPEHPGLPMDDEETEGFATEFL